MSLSHSAAHAQDKVTRNTWQSRSVRRQIRRRVMQFTSCQNKMGCACVQDKVTGETRQSRSERKEVREAARRQQQLRDKQTAAERTSQKEAQARELAQLPEAERQRQVSLISAVRSFLPTQKLHCDAIRQELAQLPEAERQLQAGPSAHSIRCSDLYQTTHTGSTHTDAGCASAGHMHADLRSAASSKRLLSELRRPTCTDHISAGMSKACR